jgi:hypothetical protein
MSREDIEKLLGGYATGTLTPEERQALFAAALSDQELFDALAREQSLRDLLRDPAARAHLLAALEDAPEPGWSALWARWRRPLAIAVTVAGVAGMGVFLARRNMQAPRPVTVALMKPPPAPAAPAKPELQTGPAQVRVAREAKAKKAKAPQPAPPAEAPVAIAEVRPAETATRRALFYAGRAEKAAAVPPSAPNQGAPVPQQRALAATDSLLLPAAPVSAGSEVRLGVRYSVLRRLPGGEFAEVDPDQELTAGETVKLRFVPNDSGYLSVLESGPGGLRRTVATSRVERSTAFETPELKPGEPGQNQYYVLFTRRPQAAFTAASQSFAGPSGANLIPMGTHLGERAAYGVTASGDPGSQQVTFTITLKYK